MENAAEALRMAGGFLIFVLALTISINAFTQARQGIDDVVLYSDREYLSLYLEQNNNTKRIVGAESIVPTIYRAYKENVKIDFKFLNDTDEDSLYLKENKVTSEIEHIRYIDLEKEKIADEATKEYIIKRILYGVKMKDLEIEKKLPMNFCSSGIGRDGLYSRIKGKNYEESLGVYYPDEAQGTNDKSTINKTEKKVITYNNT